MCSALSTFVASDWISLVSLILSVKHLLPLLFLRVCFQLYQESCLVSAAEDTMFPVMLLQCFIIKLKWLRNGGLLLWRSYSKWSQFVKCFHKDALSIAMLFKRVCIRLILVSSDKQCCLIGIRHEKVNLLRLHFPILCCDNSLPMAWLVWGTKPLGYGEGTIMFGSPDLAATNTTRLVMSQLLAPKSQQKWNVLNIGHWPAV